MKKLKEYEEEVDIQVKENCPELADTIDLQSIKDIYHQAIKEILEEVVGEDDKLPDNPTQHQTAHLMITGYNQAKAEIRANAAKVLGEIKK